MGSEESIFALVAVDSLGVVTTVLADTATLVATVNVHRFASHVNFLRVDAFVRVTVAVASCGMDSLAESWRGTD